MNRSAPQPHFAAPDAPPAAGADAAAGAAAGVGASDLLEVVDEASASLPDATAGVVADFASPWPSAFADEVPPLKSVTYQPDPFSWKPAAVTCLRNPSAPQAGQIDNGGSDTLRNRSAAWPHASQR